MAKTINTMKKLHQLIGKTASQHKNGRNKFTHNNINPKCKWTKCPSQKTQTGKLDKKSKPKSLLYSGNPSHMQGHTQAQNKGMEEDLPSAWRAKKEELQSQSLMKQTLNQQRSKETRALHNGKRITETRRANDPIYAPVSTQIHNASS